MSILLEGLFLLLGIVCGAFGGFPSVMLIALGPWSAEAVARGRGWPVARRQRNAILAVTLLAVAHVVWVWFLSGWIVAWLGCAHPWALRIGATIGAACLGGMGWIFLCSALDRMITEPGPAPAAGPAIDGDGRVSG